MEKKELSDQEKLKRQQTIKKIQEFKEKVRRNPTSAYTPILKMYIRNLSQSVRD